MKQKRSKARIRLLPLLMCAVMIFGAVPAYAVEGTEVQDAKEFSETGYLATVDDTETYTFTVDHSVDPEIVLYAYAVGATGDGIIRVTDESGANAAGIMLRGTSSDTYGTAYVPKSFDTISDTTGAVKNYTITVTTSTGNFGYQINVGTIDTMAEDFGGRENVATVAKNTPASNTAAIGSSAHFKGYMALLSNGGEWFRYTADGYTYITASITNYNNLSFEVWLDDPVTPVRIYQTSSDDRVIERHSSTLYEGHVQYGVELVPGQDYLIHVYSPSTVIPDDPADFYNIYLGLPSYTSLKTSFVSDTTYSIPAYTTQTFRIPVEILSDNAQPNSLMAGSQTKVSFTTSSSTNNSYISSCIITAPNGYSFSALKGSYNSFDNPDVVNYFTNPNNVQINGTWTVSIRSTKALSGLSLKISGYVREIVGNYNEELP